MKSYKSIPDWIWYEYRLGHYVLELNFHGGTPVRVAVKNDETLQGSIKRCYRGDY